MDNFYVLKSDDGESSAVQWATASPVDFHVLGDGQRCPICGSPVTRRPWLPPHLIKLSKFKPAKWPDFLWCSDESLLLSQRAKQVYSAEGLSGIFSFSPPVTIVRMGTYKEGQFPHSPPLYHLIDILWGGADQDDRASGLVLDNPQTVKCTYCRTGHTRRKQDRIVLVPGSWKGQDLFIPRNSPVPFLVSEKFKQAAEAAGLTNVRFIPAESYAFDDNRASKWFVNQNKPEPTLIN